MIETIVEYGPCQRCGGTGSVPDGGSTTGGFPCPSCLGSKMVKVREITRHSDPLEPGNPFIPGSPGYPWCNTWASC